MNPSIYPMRVLSTEYFVNRCRLEAAKWSPYGKRTEWWSGTGQQYNIGIIKTNAAGSLEYETNDSLENNGYSFLAPSIVTLADPLRNTDVYNSTYSAFKPYYVATSYLDSTDLPVSTFLSPDFTNWNNYDKLFANLLNFSLNKKQDMNINFGEASYDNASGTPLVLPPQLAPLISFRESYKRLIERLGITFHGDKHDQFFGASPIFPRPPGADEVVKTEDLKEVFPLSLQDDFSDGTVLSVEAMKAFIYSKKQNLIDVEYSKARISGYSPDVQGSKFKILPNNFKLPYVYDNRKTKIGAAMALIHDFLEDVLGSSFLYPSFFFFQNNLTTRIEVFRGVEGENSKNDLKSWQMLRKSDFFSLVEGELLFCRLKIFDEGLKNQIELPILDQYFFIHNGDMNVSDIPPAPLPPPPKDPSDDQNYDNSKAEAETGVTVQDQSPTFTPGATEEAPLQEGAVEPPTQPETSLAPASAPIGGSGFNY